LTVGRLSPTAYYIVTGTGFATHDFDWISRSIPEGLDARLSDVTSANAVLSVMGPRSREVLQALTEHDMSNEAFPFGSIKRITLAGAPILALRVTYVGELGWELHIPVEFAATVYDALMHAGERHGIANAGYRAIESLRLEKGYRAWGVDIGPDHSPLVAGLGWAVKLKSQTPFQGRAALEEQAAKLLPRLLAGFTTDPAIVLLGRETIYRDGKRVGWLTSGGYGYTIGRSIGYGYVRDPENGVDRAKVLSGRYELEVATERVPAEVFLDPLYDPKMARIKA
jgi:4-methylaminobutanoate oxidase (formaldehyde-forming)